MTEEDHMMQIYAQLVYLSFPNIYENVHDFRSPVDAGCIYAVTDGRPDYAQ